MDTVIISLDDTQIIFEVNDALNVYSAKLCILDKQIEGTLDKNAGQLTIQIEDILNKIQLPMCYCHLRIEMTDTTIVKYNDLMLEMVPVL
jgi:hypothetical protein